MLYSSISLFLVGHFNIRNKICVDLLSGKDWICTMRYGSKHGTASSIFVLILSLTSGIQPWLIVARAIQGAGGGGILQMV